MADQAAEIAEQVADFMLDMKLLKTAISDSGRSIHAYRVVYGKILRDAEDTFFEFPMAQKDEYEEQCLQILAEIRVKGKHKRQIINRLNNRPTMYAMNRHDMTLAKKYLRESTEITVPAKVQGKNREKLIKYGMEIGFEVKCLTFLFLLLLLAFQRLSQLSEVVSVYPL